VSAARTTSMIGRYRVVDRLATGGMADVYLVVDEADPDARPLVLKRILPHLAQDPTFVRMFEQEARIAMSVLHPNVVKIHRMDVSDGMPALVMDYIDGLTFRQVGRAAAELALPIPVGVALDLIVQACAGAHAVHETQIDGNTEIVHRDLCPHNLMVDHDGQVQLLDFGIAKAAQGMDNTKTGVLKGKTSYLSPEQVRSAPVDRRTDLWALSAVAWELLAGRRLFDSDNEFDTLQRIVEGDVPRLDTVRPDLPSSLVETIHRSLSRDIGERFPDALAMRDALLNAADREDIVIDREQTAAFVARVHGVPVFPRTTEPTTVHVRKRRRSPWPAVFLAVAFLVFGGGALLGSQWLRPIPLEGEVVRITFAPILPAAEMAEELDPVRIHLERTLRRPVTIQIAPSYNAAGGLLATGQTEIAVLPPALFLAVQRELGEKLLPLAMTEVDRARGVEGVLVVHRDLDWQGSDSLKGQTLCLTDPSSATGFALPQRWLVDEGLDPERDLRAIHLSGDHHQVIVDVANGTCTAGAVYSGALRSGIDAGVPVHMIRQAEIIGYTPNDAVCAGPLTDPQLAEDIKVALLAFRPEDVTGDRVVGKRQRITGFGEVILKEYEPLRRALQP
jgi:ABC-type phosphate/phosphonate transport system substrate-binding protein